MHPIEHLRYVARSRRLDPAELVREAAAALASMGTSGPDLVIACRRMVERHPEVGPLWWLCARVLAAREGSSSAWDLADDFDCDRTDRALAAALPDGATVLTIGWPAVVSAGLMRRGDVRVLCADSRHEASGLMQLLERVDVDCEPVDTESLARAASACDAVLIEATAASHERLLAPVGSHVLAAVGRSVGVPVWCVAGVGRRLPGAYVDAIAARVLPERDDWDGDVDEVPVDAITHVVTADGASAVGASSGSSAWRADCAFAPELLRTSAI